MSKQEQTDEQWAKDVVDGMAKAAPQLRAFVDRLWDKHPNNPKNKKDSKFPRSLSLSVKTEEGC